MLEDAQEPKGWFSSLDESARELMKSDKEPVDFAIEAIRINLCAAIYKNEIILNEAMLRLQNLKD